MSPLNGYTRLHLTPVALTAAHVAAAGVRVGTAAPSVPAAVPARPAAVRATARLSSEAAAALVVAAELPVQRQSSRENYNKEINKLFSSLL